MPSLALGTGLVTPLDLTAAYTMFPGGGEVARAARDAQVLDADGTPGVHERHRARRIVSPEVAFQMTSMLRDVVERGTGNAARALGVRGPVGGKDRHDRRLSRRLVRRLLDVGGRRRLGRLRSAGADRPRRVRRAHRAADLGRLHEADRRRFCPLREFAVPDGLQAEELCSVSYLKPVDGCPTYTEYFKDGDTMPSELCPIHRVR